MLYFRALADEELQTNIARSEIFVLPSGQEIEKENILFTTLYSICLNILHDEQGGPLVENCF